MTKADNSIFLVVEHDNNTVNSSCYHLVTAALKLGKNITACVMGYNCKSVAEKVATIAGISKVLLFDAEQFQDFLPEYCVPAIISVAHAYNYFIAAASVFGKNILPRLAAKLDVTPLANITTIIADTIFEHPIYCGNILETVEILSEKKILTLRPYAFDAVLTKQAVCPIVSQSIVLPHFAIKILETKSSLEGIVNLNCAQVVVAGGRALKSRENFAMIEELAYLLKAGIGATRAAVDLGYAPGSCQVGQTGVVVAPKVYIGVGISGAMQHIVGMQDSKIIIAINNDENAPIFKIAHYGLIGDLFDFLPKIIALIKQDSLSAN